MAIKQAAMSKVKSDANISIARAKARAAQVTANAHALKAKQFMNRPKPQA